MAVVISDLGRSYRESTFADIDISFMMKTLLELVFLNKIQDIK